VLLQTTGPRDCCNLTFMIQIHQLNDYLCIYLLKIMLFFTEDGDLEEMIENPRNVRIKLISWLEINNTSLDARNYTYTEFSEHFTWHANGKSWNTRREKHNKISRIAHVSPAQGETYYLHMLLHIVKGAKSFSEI
jgi:hypothetical protein